MKKLTNEQLSRLFTAHSRGDLVRKGNYETTGVPGCLYQIVNATKFIQDEDELIDIHVMDWFDLNYDRKWTLEQFKKQLFKKGLI